MARRQLQIQARRIIERYLSICGLHMRCTRIAIKPGLLVNGERAWASVKVTGTDTFCINLEADMLSPLPDKPALNCLLGHEIGHLVLSGLELSHGNEERICDLIGDILARSE